MKEATLAAKLSLADTPHYVEDGMLHLFSKGSHAAALALVPIIDGESLDIVSWNKKGDAIIGNVRGNGGMVQLSKTGDTLVYRIKGRFGHVASAIYFPASQIEADAYHAFVPDWSNRTFDISEDADIIAATAADPEFHDTERGHPAWMMAPAPRDIAFKIGGGWWGISIPGALPLGETHLAVRRKKLSIEFNNYEAVNTGGNLPEAYIAVNLDSPYAILDADHAASKVRKEAGIRKKYYRWWSRPIFSTWGEQTRSERPLDIEHSLLNTRNVLDWVSATKDNTGTADFTVAIDEPWFDKYGDFYASIARFGGTPGMRELIEQLHNDGHKVILWFTPFKTDRDSDIATTEPDSLLLGRNQELFTAGGSSFRDYTSVVARNTLRNNLRYCLSDDADSLNADGLKIDLCHQSPDPALTSLRNNRWGFGDEYFKQVLQHIHDDARYIKPDCLIMAAAAQAYLEPYIDMVRLNQLEGNDTAAWYNRAKMARHIAPACIIDTAGWPMTAARLAEYLMTSPVFGVPAISCVTAFSDGRPLEESDWRRWAAALQVYQNAPVAPDMLFTIEPETGTFSRLYGRGPLKGSLAAACFEKCCLATFSTKCVRVAATRDTTVRLPIHARPERIEAVFHDGRRKPMRKRGAVRKVSLDVPDAASDVKYIEITLQP